MDMDIYLCIVLLHVKLYVVVVRLKMNEGGSSTLQILCYKLLRIMASGAYTVYIHHLFVPYNNMSHNNKVNQTRKRNGY